MYRATKLQRRNPGTHLLIIFSWNFTILLYFELLTRLITDDSLIELITFGLFNTLQFSLATTMLIIALIYCFSEKYHYFLSALWLILLFIIFSSQLVYHHIFQTFYHFQSIFHLQQGLGFRDIIISAIVPNLWWICLSVFLIGLFIYFGLRYRRRYVPNKHRWKHKLILISCFLSSFFIFHYLAVWNLQTDERAVDVYFNIHHANLSTEKLGLLTTVRIDVQRYLTGWSPTLASTPVVTNENDVETDHVDTTPSASDNKLTEHSDKTNDERHQLSKNKLAIPFDTLIEQTKDKEIEQMHQYFQQQTATNKNEFTGKYEGYNLIWITAEAFAPYAIDKELTPSLYKLSEEGYQFTNFYNPIWSVSTSDGEYTILHSLVPKSGVWSFSESAHNDVPFVMGNQLKKEGYETRAYHNHTYDYYDRDLSHPNMGYDYKGVGHGLSISQLWPESDLEMIEETIDEYIDKEPFHTYYITVSGHLEYNFIGNQMAMKNREFVDHLDLSDQAKAYLAGQIELDRALEELMSRLEEANLLDKTLIALTGDHYPYGLENKTIEELTGKPLDKKFGIYKNEWILYATDMKEENVVVEEPTYTLDMLPTISNLMGVDFDSRLLMGRDVFSESEPLVVFNDRSFITKELKYYVPEDEITSLTNKPIDEEHFKKMKQKTDEIFYFSTKILDLDYYSFLKWEEMHSSRN